MQNDFQSNDVGVTLRCITSPLRDTEITATTDKRFDCIMMIYDVRNCGVKRVGGDGVGMAILLALTARQLSETIII